jgi:hypothetical protein
MEEVIDIHSEGLSHTLWHSRAHHKETTIDLET